MLVLGRRENETIMIGDDIVVTVIRIDRGQVRIGVTAPREIVVHRGEVYEQIKRQKGDVL